MGVEVGQVGSLYDLGEGVVLENRIILLIWFASHRNKTEISELVQKAWGHRRSHVHGDQEQLQRHRPPSLLPSWKPRWVPPFLEIGSPSLNELRECVSEVQIGWICLASFYYNYILQGQQWKSTCLMTERSWFSILLGAGLFIFSILSVESP